ncbi:unnamed protein product [Chilo suppressalis]|uniref:Uncharacterized protein n=1 Tax=Chilo suppressalis TaxID=168631 RepID=A0ABN8AYQ0_CHISP|nr:unnamed protein product [Chilo suppressalis]
MRGYPQPCVFVEIFYHVRQNCGICCRQQCFRTYTTQKRSKKERTPSLKAGIAFVILLVLQVSMGDGDHLPSELLDSKVSGNWLDEMRAKIFDLVDDHGYVGADPYIKKLVEETEKKQNLLLYVEVKKDGTANINFQTSKRSASQPVGAVYGRCLWVAGLCYVVEDFRKVQIQDIDVEVIFAVIGHLMGDQKSSTSSFSCFERHVKPLVPAASAVLRTRQSALGPCGARDENFMVHTFDRHYEINFHNV